MPSVLSVRKTYGFNKKVDRIANFQIGEITRLRKDVVSRALARLYAKGLIVRNGKKVGLQKDWEEWKLTRQQTNEKLAKQPTKVCQIANKSWLNSPPQKKKEIIKEKERKQVSSSPSENKEVREIFAALKLLEALT